MQTVYRAQKEMSQSNAVRPTQCHHYSVNQ